MLQGAAGQVADFLEFQGLGHIVKGALLDGGDGGVQGSLAGYQDDLGFGPPGFGLLQDFHAVESGQHHIQKDQVNIAQVQVPEKGLPRTIGLDAMAIFFQGCLESFLDDNFIIHYGEVHGTPDAGRGRLGFV